MTMLDLLAEQVAVSGRTLRRAAARGLIRASRPSERKLVVPPSELAYVRMHWSLLSGLLEALRKQPNVRLAVLYGSLARGQTRPESDLDLLVRLRRDDPQARADVVDALAAASGRRVQLVSLAQAEEAPLLLADVLADGRVLVDRDGDWRRLHRRRTQIARRALAEDERLGTLAWTAPEALEQVRKRMTAGPR
jgi:predicted nucleotidyltransferase